MTEDRLVAIERIGPHLSPEARSLLVELIAEIRFLKGHGTDAEPKEPLTHLDFPGGRYEERNPLCVKVLETWQVAQPWSGGQVILWPLPDPWQEWLEAEGNWRFVWTDEDDWTLEYVR